MLIPNCFSYCMRGRESVSKGHVVRGTWVLEIANLSQVLLHNFRAIVHGENNVGHTGRGKGLDLVKNHTLVAELDQGLGHGQGLY